MICQLLSSKLKLLNLCLDILKIILFAKKNSLQPSKRTTILMSSIPNCCGVLTQAEGLETAAQCTPWIPGRWAGPATPEEQWTVQRVAVVVTHYFTLHYIIALTIFMPYKVFYFYTVIIFITHCNIGCYYVFIITYYHIIITSLLRNITMEIM